MPPFLDTLQGQQLSRPIARPSVSTGAAAPVFQEAIQNALPDQQQLETASSRLQSRLAAQSRGNERALQDRFASQGQAGSGAFQNAILQNQQNILGQTATGLADLEQGFQDKRQEGAGILSGIGTGITEGELGRGRLGNEQQVIDETQRKNQQEALLSFFNTFIEGGNLASSGKGRGESFDQDFQRILQQIFGTFG